MDMDVDMFPFKNSKRAQQSTRSHEHSRRSSIKVWSSRDIARDSNPTKFENQNQNILTKNVKISKKKWRTFWKNGKIMSGNKTSFVVGGDEVDQAIVKQLELSFIQEHSELRNQLEEKQQTVINLRMQIAAITEKNANTLKEIRDAEEETARISTNIVQLKTSVDSIKECIQYSEGTLKMLEKKVAEEKEKKSRRSEHLETVLEENRALLQRYYTIYESTKSAQEARNLKMQLLAAEQQMRSRDTEIDELRQKVQRLVSNTRDARWKSITDTIVQIAELKCETRQNEAKILKFQRKQDLCKVQVDKMVVKDTFVAKENVTPSYIDDQQVHQRQSLQPGSLSSKPSWRPNPPPLLIPPRSPFVATYKPHGSTVPSEDSHKSVQSQSISLKPVTKQVSFSNIYMHPTLVPSSFGIFKTPAPKPVNHNHHHQQAMDTQTSDRLVFQTPTFQNQPPVAKEQQFINSYDSQPSCIEKPQTKRQLPADTSTPFFTVMDVTPAARNDRPDPVFSLFNLSPQSTNISQTNSGNFADFAFAFGGFDCSPCTDNKIGANCLF